MYADLLFCRSAIYASRLYLNQYHKTHPERLAINKYGGPKICGECMPLIFFNLMHLYSILMLEMTLLIFPHFLSLGNVYIHPTANIDPTAVVCILLCYFICSDEIVQSKVHQDMWLL